MKCVETTTRKDPILHTIIAPAEKVDSEQNDDGRQHQKNNKIAVTEITSLISYHSFSDP